MGLAKYTKDDKDRHDRGRISIRDKVKTLYGPEDLERVGFSYEKDLADPGPTLSPGAYTRKDTGAGPGQ